MSLEITVNSIEMGFFDGFVAVESVIEEIEFTCLNQKRKA